MSEGGKVQHTEYNTRSKRRLPNPYVNLGCREQTELLVRNNRAGQREKPITSPEIHVYVPPKQKLLSAPAKKKVKRLKSYARTAPTDQLQLLRLSTMDVTQDHNEKTSPNPNVPIETITEVKKDHNLEARQNANMPMETMTEVTEDNNKGARPNPNVPSVTSVQIQQAPCVEVEEYDDTQLNQIFDTTFGTSLWEGQLMSVILALGIIVIAYTLEAYLEILIGLIQ